MLCKHSTNTSFSHSGCLLLICIRGACIWGSCRGGTPAASCCSLPWSWTTSTLPSWGCPSSSRRERTAAAEYALRRQGCFAGAERGFHGCAGEENREPRGRNQGPAGGLGGRWRFESLAEEVAVTGIWRLISNRRRRSSRR